MPATQLMTRIVLTLKQRPHVPLEAEVLTPDVLAPLSHDEVRALPVLLGKRQCRLDDFFEVEGAGSGGRGGVTPPLQEIRGDAGSGGRGGVTPPLLEIRGDAGRVKWIGRGMTRGHIAITGDAGMHLGAYMKGGTIEVTGNASDWVGAEMKGGCIRIRGNAGGQIGAAYRGSLSGMNNGTILIDGSAGIEVGMRMRRGIIAVKGPVRDFAGLQMKGGTIVLMGGAEIRTGAWMVRGTIVALTPIRLLPTFSHACDYNPAFLRLYAKHLRALGFSIPCEDHEGTYRRYTGDASVPGKSEILVWQPRGA